MSKPPQLKPRPRVFLVLCIVFAVWMALLLVLYFWTVYPRRHPTAIRQGLRNLHVAG